jgi:hypothetical protein
VNYLHSKYLYGSPHIRRGALKAWQVFQQPIGLAVALQQYGKGPHSARKNVHASRCGKELQGIQQGN